MTSIKQFLIPWASVCLVLAVNPVSAETVHIAHCQQVCPQVSDSDNELVVRHLYAASINPEWGLAEWVAYRVVDGAIGIASLLPRYWEADALMRSSIDIELDGSEGPRVVRPDLSNAQDSEYRTSEFLFNPEDRGRLAPMTSFGGTPYWEELNNLSNMAPIPPALRIGSWARLEQAINRLTEQSDLYVITGPLPDNNGEVTAYYKVVRNDTAQAAFIFATDLAEHVDFCEQSSSLAMIEQQLDLSLFPALRLDNSLLGDLGCRTP